jgi:hypothetical protein
VQVLTLNSSFSYFKSSSGTSIADGFYSSGTTSSQITTEPDLVGRWSIHVCRHIIAKGGWCTQTCNMPISDYCSCTCTHVTTHHHHHHHHITTHLSNISDARERQCISDLDQDRFNTKGISKTSSRCSKERGRWQKKSRNQQAMSKCRLKNMTSP